MSRLDEHFRLRIPGDIKEWVRDRASANLRSITAEINFILREKMAAAGEVSEATAPAAASINNTALQGSASITQGLRGTSDD